MKVTRNLFLLFYVLLSFLPLESLAKVSVGKKVITGFQCFTTNRDTRMQLIQNESEIKIYYSHPMGYEMIPMMEGPISSFQIPFFKMQADDLKSLGTEFEIRWSKSKCQSDLNKKLIDCSGEGHIQTYSSKQNETRSFNAIVPLSLRSYSVQEEALNLDFSSQLLKYRFILEAAGNYYFIIFQFPKERCF